MRRPVAPQPRRVSPPLMADEVGDVALLASLAMMLAGRVLDDLERIAAELVSMLTPLATLKAQVAP